MAKADYLIVTGLCRKVPEFLERFEISTRTMDHRPQFVFSTWHDEVKNNPEEIKSLEAAGFEIFAQPEPQVIMTGHMLHQLQALLGALQFCPEGAMVARSRTDYFQPKFLESDDLDPTKLTIDQAISGVPFAINDMNFASTCAKLKALCAVPILYDACYCDLQTEQMIWGHQYEAATPWIHSVLKRIRFEDYRINYKSRDLLPSLFAHAPYLRALEEYFVVLLEHFAFIRGATRSELGFASEQSLEDAITTDGLLRVTYHNVVGMNKITHLSDCEILLEKVRATLGDSERALTEENPALISSVHTDPALKGWVGWRTRLRMK